MKIIDRILIESILPHEGNYTDLIVIKDIKSKVSLTQDEIIKYEVKSLENGTIEWKNEGYDEEIKFSELEKSIIKKALEKLNSENKLNFQLLNIYELFK